MRRPGRHPAPKAHPGLFCLALLACCAASEDAPPDLGEPGPNVVLISIDTLRADHMSLHGYHRKTTPRLEAFAEQAVVYENVISPATWTVPAHSSMFTGLLPSFHGANQTLAAGWRAMPLDESFVTLAEILAGHGYETAAIVGNTGFLKKIFGVGQGFETYVDKHMWNAKFVNRTVFSWLDARERDPFFLFVNYLEPHEPYSPPAPYDQAFPGRREDFVDVRRKVRNGTHVLTREEAEHYISQYDGEILYVDEMVGLLLDKLIADGDYDNTLLIVTSDHGDLFGEHGYLGHGFLPYDGLLRVPLIVKHPQQTRGRVVGTYVSTVDITPTVLDVLGIDAPGPMQGLPLRERSGFVVSEHHDPKGGVTRVVHDGHTKLFVRGEGATAQADLFDVAADPGEEQPLSGMERERKAMLAHLEELVQNASPPEQRGVQEVDEDTQRTLRELGYLE